MERVCKGYAERDGVAVIELADVSGFRRLPGDRPAPRTASSYGTGQVLRAALDAGCRRIILGAAPAPTAAPESYRRSARGYATHRPRPAEQS
jgi:glycerate kinase